jgi:hypothetical protein
MWKSECGGGEKTCIKGVGAQTFVKTPREMKKYKTVWNCIKSFTIFARKLLCLGVNQSKTIWIEHDGEAWIKDDLGILMFIKEKF